MGDDLVLYINPAIGRNLIDVTTHAHPGRNRFLD